MKKYLWCILLSIPLLILAALGVVLSWCWYPERIPPIPVAFWSLLRGEAKPSPAGQKMERGIMYFCPPTRGWNRCRLKWIPLLTSN